MKKLFRGVCLLGTLLLSTMPMFASEASLVVPNIKEDPLSYNLLIAGIVVAVIGSVFGLIEYAKIKKISVHPAMEAVGATIFETCKTYLVQQGKFLILLEVLIALCIAYYFGFLEKMGIGGVGLILL
ncbi:MAG: hypothetical protein IKL52_00315, partial [Candidatus Gastranaerophilales bacterium]|nr:hypothetical protein [Candidatus Gastranaerophilales bacterium]